MSVQRIGYVPDRRRHNRDRNRIRNAAPVHRRREGQEELTTRALTSAQPRITNLNEIVPSSFLLWMSVQRIGYVPDRRRHNRDRNRVRNAAPVHRRRGGQEELTTRALTSAQPGNHPLMRSSPPPSSCGCLYHGCVRSRSKAPRPRSESRFATLPGSQEEGTTRGTHDRETSTGQRLLTSSSFAMKTRASPIRVAGRRGAVAPRPPQPIC